MISLVNQTHGAFCSLLLSMAATKRTFIAWFVNALWKCQIYYFARILMTIQTNQVTLSFLSSFCTIIFHDQVKPMICREEMAFSFWDVRQSWFPFQKSSFCLLINELCKLKRKYLDIEQINRSIYLNGKTMQVLNIKILHDETIESPYLFEQLSQIFCINQISRES